MNTSEPKPLATAAVAAAAAPSLLTQVGMAGSAAVITVTFIHPIDVIKVGCCAAMPPTAPSSWSLPPSPPTPTRLYWPLTVS
jgi:hypothetical protein